MLLCVTVTELQQKEMKCEKDLGIWRNRVHGRVAVKTGKGNPARARGEDWPYGTFFRDGCVRRRHALVYELAAIREPRCCTETSFF